MNEKTINLYSGIIQTQYLYEKNHGLLLNNSTLKSIGDYGENLTIATITLNRSVLTTKLMRTIADQIPNFKGELLIVDNGSERSEISNLKKEIENMPYKCRIIELRKNYGPSAGRNIAIENANTDWVCCLDNDIYLIGNPLSEIDKIITELGCHFINLPFLDESGGIILALGGHMFINNDGANIFINGGTAYEQEYYNNDIRKDPFLSTFIFEGACVINKTTFLSTGGYDEKLFVFEGIDYSIKLYEKGLKIGNCGEFYLIHDHKKPLYDVDLDYERRRWSEKVMKDSADYFIRKHGMSVWTDRVSDWLKEIRIQLGLNEEVPKVDEYFSCNYENSQEIKQEEQVDISIITECKDGFESLQQFVESILSINTTINYEIIVVIDSKNTEINEIECKGLSNKVNILRIDKLDFAEAKNIGASSCRGKYILFCDIGTRMNESGLDNLKATLLENNIDVAIPAINIISNDGYIAYGSTWNHKFQPLCLLSSPGTVTEVPFPNESGCMFLSKDTFNRIGGFNRLLKSNLMTYHEFFFKAWTYGYKVAINPSIILSCLMNDVTSFEKSKPEIIHDALCIAYCHFKRERLERVIRIFRNKFSFNCIAECIESNMNFILSEREKNMKERFENDDFFFNKFNMQL